MATNGEKEQRIRERAYQIWLHEGRPEGRDRDHWQQAEEQIQAEDGDQQSADEQQGIGELPPVAGPYENIS